MSNIVQLRSAPEPIPSPPPPSASATREIPTPYEQALLRENQKLRAEIEIHKATIATLVQRLKAIIGMASGEIPDS